MNDIWHWDRKRPKVWPLSPGQLRQDYHWCQVYAYQGQHPDGHSHEFIVINCKDWVQCVALTEDKELVLVSQFRAGNKALTLELPGGGVEKGEDIVRAAQRELKEESGYTGAHPIHLYTCYPNPAMQTNQVHFYLIPYCKKTQDTAFDPDEDLATYLLPLSQLDSALDQGVFEHAMTLTGLLLLKRWLQQHPQDLENDKY